MGSRAVYHRKTSTRKTSSVLVSAPAPRLVGVAAAAAYLSCTVWAIRQLQWDKKIPYVRIGQRLLFDIRDLDAFVERSKEASR
jgi:excisionase family DNA binding protein